MPTDRKIDPPEKATDSGHDPLAEDVAMDPTDLWMLELAEKQQSKPSPFRRAHATEMGAHLDPKLSTEDLQRFIEEQKKNPGYD